MLSIFNLHLYSFLKILFSVEPFFFMSNTYIIWFLIIDLIYFYSCCLGDSFLFFVLVVKYLLFCTYRLLYTFRWVKVVIGPFMFNFGLTVQENVDGLLVCKFSECGSSRDCSYTLLSVKVFDDNPDIWPCLWDLL